MTKQEFAEKYGFAGSWKLRERDDHLPCFAHRWSVNDKICTARAIREYIKMATENDDNDVIVFSVTERDAGWAAWASYHEAHPHTFKMVEGGSIHDKYMCRMYIYTKPAGKRKFHKNNIANYRAR